MKELSLHIMDLAQNCITAGAGRIEIAVLEDQKKDLLSICIQDDGCGMDEEFQRRVTSPFTTSRTTRKVGLGIPMFKESAEATGGSLTVESKKGVGTTITATFGLSHIDRVPMGDLAETILMLVVSNPQMDMVLTVKVNEKVYDFDTRQIRQALGEEIPLDAPEVSTWMLNDLKEGIWALDGGM